MDTAKVGRSPLPDRAEHAVHQQSRRAQRADDEIAAEDLRRLSLRVRRRRLRRYPMAALDCQTGRDGACSKHSQAARSNSSPTCARHDHSAYLGSNDVSYTGLRRARFSRRHFHRRKAVVRSAASCVQCNRFRGFWSSRGRRQPAASSRARPSRQCR
jgi:hypothetical protein